MELDTPSDEGGVRSRVLNGDTLDDPGVRLLRHWL